MGRHHKPSRVALIPIAGGAALAAASLLTWSSATVPHEMAPTAQMTPLAPLMLPLPPLTPSSAALYLPPLPPAPVEVPEVKPQEVVQPAAKPQITAQPKPQVATQTRTSSAATVTSAALSQKGVPYVWGGTSPNGFDCSGLVQWAYKRVGVALPRVAADQSRVGRSVPLSQVQPGDLIFYAYGKGVSHVAMAVGNGLLVEAPQPGQRVSTRPIYTSNLASIRRIVN